MQKQQDIEQLKNLAVELGISIDPNQDTSVLAEPVDAGQLHIPNSLAIHPMEAADGDSQGRPGELAFRRYKRYAAGGAGLIWAEAIAVTSEARANPCQLWLNQKSKDSFAELITSIRNEASKSPLKHEPVIVAQLTHSGRYSKPEGVRQPLILQRDPYKDAFVLQQKPQKTDKSVLPDDYPIVTDEYLDNLIDSYVETAKLAYEAGFDAVDIKSCHGYLINELLACHTRQGKYGGSFENRTRFLLAVIDRIHQKLGADKQVVTRLSVYDGTPYPYGWAADKDDYTKPDLTEPKKLVSLLIDRGIKLINVTIGNPHYNPHFGRPYNKPVAKAYDSPEHPIKGVVRLIAVAGEIQKQYPEIAVVGTGYSWLGALMPLVAASLKQNGLTKIFGIGRMAFAYPDFAQDIISKGKLDYNKACIACSACSQIMVDGGMIGCVVRDRDIYGPIYETAQAAKKDASR